MSTTQSTADSIAAAIAHAIGHGDPAPGDQLPTEAEAVDRFNVSRETVRKAYRKLAGELGLVYSVRGHGWYVRDDNRLRYPLLTLDRGRATAITDVWRGFLDSIGRRGDHISHDPFSTCPPEKVRLLLKLRPDEETVVRHRIRRVDGTPWMLSTAYFPGYIAFGTPLASLRDMQNPSPLRWLLENGYGAVRDEDLIGGRMPTADEIRLLDLAPGVPVITSHRTSWDRHGRPVRCTADVFPTHRFELVVTQDNAHEPPPDPPFGLNPTRT